MSLHTTNYKNTFIESADDSKAQEGKIPPHREGTTTEANHHFDMIYDNPYRYTSDDIIFKTYAAKNNLSENKNERETFFSKGQPCLRCSPLTKRYGWGIHSDDDGRVAMYPVGSEEYKKFVADENLQHVKAMRSTRRDK